MRSPALNGPAATALASIALRSCSACERPSTWDPKVRPFLQGVPSARLVALVAAVSQL